jgi:hypothetical protein
MRRQRRNQRFFSGVAPTVAFSFFGVVRFELLTPLFALHWHRSDFGTFPSTCST